MKAWLIIGLLFLFFIALVAAQTIINPAVIPNQGNITTINIEVNPTTLNWQRMIPGETKNLTVQICPDHPTPMTLNYTVNATTPPDLWQYVTLTWNYTGIAITDWTPIQFTLTINENAPVNETTPKISFSFNIIITGNEIES